MADLFEGYRDTRVLAGSRARSAVREFPRAMSADTFTRSMMLRSAMWWKENLTRGWNGGQVLFVALTRPTEKRWAIVTSSWVAGATTQMFLRCEGFMTVQRHQTTTSGWN